MAPRLAFLRRPHGAPRVSNPQSARNAKHNSLTAAGFRVQRQDADAMRRLIQPWQSRAFAYYDLLGEIKYAAQFYSRALANLELYAAEIDPTTKEVVRTSDPDAIAALDRIQDPGGGRSSLLASYGRLMFLVGECYLLCSIDPESGLEQWEMLSTDELRIVGPNAIVRYKAPSLNAEEYREPKEDDWEPLNDREAIPYRLWKRHPRYSMLADSTMQGVLDLCEELVLLTQAVRARARSRLAGSGILFISEDFSSAPLEPVGDEDPEEDIFLADLIESMTAPIVDEGAASAVVPLVVRGATDAIDKGIKHLQLVDPTQLYPETGLRYECIKRIAIGLDMPPEILLGIMDANHWTGWMIDEQSWKAHLQPVAQQLVDDLTASYYRPSLRDDGKANWERFCIAYDATAIINHPDRGTDAEEAYDRRAIGKAALRKAKGFDEEDAPTKDELAEMIGIAVRDGGLAWDGTPTIRGGTIETAPGVVQSATPGDDIPNTTTTGADVEPGPPSRSPAAPLPEGVVGSGNGNGLIAAARLQGAADLSVLRAREAAGNKLRTLAKRHPEMLALIEGVRAGQTAFVLGHERVRALGAPSELELVASAALLVADALRLYDVTDPEMVERVADLVAKHAARTLYEEHPSPLPAAFASYVSGLARTPA